MLESKKDLFGVDVFVGDTVAINPPKYKDLVKATVLKITPKGFTVQYYHSGHNRNMETNLNQVVKK